MCTRQFEVRHNERLATNNDYLVYISLAYYAPVICVWLPTGFLCLVLSMTLAQCFSTWVSGNSWVSLSTSRGSASFVRTSQKVIISKYLNKMSTFNTKLGSKSVLYLSIWIDSKFIVWDSSCSIHS